MIHINIISKIHITLCYFCYRKNMASSSVNFYVPNLASKPVTKHSSLSKPSCLFCKPTTKHLSISGVHYYNRVKRNQGVIRASKDTMTTIEKLGIKVVKNPPEEKLTGLGVRSWPKWGCPPSKFPWTYSSKETCFLLKGKVKVYPEGSDEAVEFGAGDLVEFPSGMSCTWDVSETVDKHYKFE